MTAEKAHQGAIVLIAVVGAGVTPPVVTGSPRRYPIGRDWLVASGRMR